MRASVLAFGISRGKWVSLLQSCYIEKPTIEATDPICLIENTLQPREIPPRFCKNHFPFFASGPRNDAEEVAVVAEAALPRLRYTGHVCPGTSRHTYVPLMKNPATMEEGVEIPIRISGADIEYTSSRNEEFRPWNSPPRAPSRRNANEGRRYFSTLSIWGIQGSTSISLRVEPSSAILPPFVTASSPILDEPEWRGILAQMVFFPFPFFRKIV